MSASEEAQEWEKRTDFDSETIAILAVIAFIIMLFGICIGAFIVIKCKRLHVLYNFDGAKADDRQVTPEPVAEVQAYQFEEVDMKKKSKNDKKDDE